MLCSVKLYLLSLNNCKYICAIPDSKEIKEEMLKKFHSFQHLAELYHVYHSIHRYMVSVHYISFDEE